MRYLFISALSVLLTIVPLTVFALDTSLTSSSLIQVQAQSLSIYSTPDTHSKVMMTLKKGQMIIPFFQQGDWMKIANPQTGEVGWVQKENLAQEATITAITSPSSQEYTVTQKDDKGNIIHSYRIDVYSNSKTLTPEQGQAIYAQFVQQKRQFQDTFNKLMNDTYQSFNLFFPDIANHAEFPFLPPFQPIIIIHEQNKNLNASQNPPGVTNSTTSSAKK
jgi:hypothetical protein